MVLDWQSLWVPRSDLFEVRDENGRLVWRSKDWEGPPASADSIGAAGFKFGTAQGTYRGVVFHKMATFEEEDNRSGPAKLIAVAYASSTADLESRVKKIELFAAVSGLWLMAFTGLLGTWAVNRGFAPIQELAREANEISVRNWTFNPSPAAKKTMELSPLVRALESALAGLKRAFSRQRDFIADAAHELKTAVAIVKSSLQLLAYQPLTLPEYQAGVMRSLDDCGRVEALVGNMLILARAEQMGDEGQREPVQPVELADSCDQAVAGLRSLAEAKGVDLQYISDGEL